MAEDEKPPPWHASGVSGIIPPGRRLSKKSKTAATPTWRASNVAGIRIDEGKFDADGDGAWRMQRSSIQKPRPSVSSSRAAAGRRKPAKSKTDAIESTRPSLKSFLDEIAAFIRENPPASSSTEMMAELITQSHAPYEITLGFTVLSALVGQDQEQRNRYASVLERGAQVFFNLAMRLDKTVEAPPGLAPQRLDPLFYDLPATAFQIPLAFATDAFLRISELLEKDVTHDRALFDFGQALYGAHILAHRYGDQALSELFEKPKELDVDPIE